MSLAPEGTFGAWLRSQRAETHRTLAQVAAAADVSLNYISDIEHGRREVSFPVCVLICKHFDFDPLSVVEEFELLPADVTEYLIQSEAARMAEPV